MLKERLEKLLSVKSIVTIILTAVFSYLSVKNNISKDFMTIYAVIIAFYYGTQANRDSTKN
jgi:5-bromo-4-chloroindolyl phosphate hydrolysis protein